MGVGRSTVQQELLASTPHVSCRRDSRLHPTSGLSPLIDVFLKRACTQLISFLLWSQPGLSGEVCHPLDGKVHLLRSDAPTNPLPCKQKAMLSLVYQFPVAAATDYHKKVAENNRNLFCHRAGGWTSTIKLSARPYVF